MNKFIFILITAIFSINASFAQHPVNTKDTKLDDILHLTAMANLPSDTISDNSGNSLEKKKEEEFVVDEKLAQFEGGDYSTFQKWLSRNLIYPEVAQKLGISGKVYVQFDLNKLGEVVNVRVARGVHPSLDNEAMRVIRSSPKWKPATQFGKPVIQQFTIPVDFKLE